MLNDLKCKSAQPKSARYRIADGGSLFLVVHPSGVKSWEFRWKREGALRGIIFGNFPDVGLKAAREQRDRYKVMLADGLDPLAQKSIAADEERRRLEVIKTRRAEERVQRARRHATFERVALEWVDRHRQAWTVLHGDQVEQSLRDHVFPVIGGRVIDSISTNDVLDVLDSILGKGALETASRVKQRLSAVYEFASLKYQVKVDPVSLVRKEFARRLKLARRTDPPRNFPCVSPEHVPALFRALRQYTGPSIRLVRWIALTI